MRKARLVFSVTLLFVLILTVSAAADVYFQETITDLSTHRITRLPDEQGSPYYEETIAGNSQFGIAVNHLSYAHSVMNIAPPLLPDGAIRKASLKFYFKNRSDDEITAVIDSVDLDNIVRHNFLIGPEGNQYVSVEDSPLRDGIIEITLDNPEGEFVLYRSVFDMRYVPAVQTGITEPENAPPVEFELSTNYPNPFNPTTIIEYNLATRSGVLLDVLNILGEPVKTLIDEVQSPGQHSVSWDGRDDSGAPVSSGIYFYRLRVGHQTATKKMILLK